MTRNELRQFIADVQKHQSEFANVEVKTARGGTPRRLYEPLAAFANRTDGGVLLFGLMAGLLTFGKYPQSFCHSS
jgi:ATP-dependent DNA helicase RecG